MKICHRIEIEGVWLERGHHPVEAGKAESHQQIDAECSKDGFRVGLVMGKDAAENDNDNKRVKHKAEDDVKDRKGTGVSTEIHDAVQKCGNC